ncbi:MAG: helix-turn-helix transcriptional regulator [Pseudomonadota bacterium]
MITREQCRAARALIEWSRAELAEAAQVSERTITDFERGARSPINASLAALTRALESGGVEFISENGGGPGVRLVKAS